MLSGNASIRRHEEEGRALRLFWGARGTVTYLDEFTLDPVEPWYETDAPESLAAGLDRKIRKVIVFRLRPTTVEPHRPTSGLAEAGFKAGLQTIPVESRWTEKAFVNPSGQSYEADRTEAVLVEKLAQFLRARGLSICRQKIVPEGERKPLFTDLYVKELNLIVEAKGSTTRESVRMAIGQLVDYSRSFQAPNRAILLPSQPRKDLVAVAASHGIVVIWPAEEGFTTTSGSGYLAGS